MLQLVLATTAACKCEWEVKGSGSSGRVHEGPQALNCCIPCAHKLENFCANLWADEEEQVEERQEVARQAGRRRQVAFDLPVSRRFMAV